MAGEDDVAYMPPEHAPIVKRCRMCGTGYTALGWGWLATLGVQRGTPGDPTDPSLDLRCCAVPRCATTLALPLADAPATIPVPALTLPPDEEPFDG